MTQQEKAQELLIKFEHPMGYVYLKRVIAKQCALVAVDEILEVLYSLKLGNALAEEIEYWEQVKHELTKQQEQ